jgi:hypothetical protein
MRPSANPLPLRWNERRRKRQPIDEIDNRRLFQKDSRIDLGSKTKAIRDMDSVDFGEFPQVGALASNLDEIRLVDFLKTKHVRARTFRS